MHMPYAVMYRGADKSLVRPGKKHANIFVRIFFIVKNCEFTIYSYGAISKCGEGEDDERE